MGVLKNGAELTHKEITSLSITGGVKAGADPGFLNGGAQVKCQEPRGMALGEEYPRPQWGRGLKCGNTSAWVTAKYCIQKYW